MATKGRAEQTHTLLNRELSHLEFHARVLELAADDTLPLLERVEFCSRFSWARPSRASRCAPPTG